MPTITRSPIAILVCSLVLLLVSCSSSTPTESPQKAQAPPKQAEYETAREAFQKMFLAAHNWAADAQPFRLQSQYSAGAPVREGKEGLWRASFASPARKQMKMFMWSGLVGPNAPEQGISFSAEDSWSPTNTSTAIFNLGFLKIDSDKAFDVAEKHGGEKLMAKDTQQPVIFVLDWDGSKNLLLWHVIYGENQDTAKLQVAVNATTGDFAGVEK
ncbi:MAG TPA: hypothetical protein VMD76_09415 [Candidatus Sulfotelmatobacter sp.]|nr:hypothetical protein [Candidatus Sulfotelmatobacter sp.]